MSSTSVRTKIRFAVSRATSGVVAAVVFCAGGALPASAATGLNKKVKDVCRTSKDAEFRAKYCTAAEDHKKGYVANRSTSAVWTGVSVVCGAACGKAVKGLVCKLSSAGGSAGEGILTKKFVDSVLGEGSKWGGEIAKGKDAAPAAGETVAAGTEVATTGKGGVNADACTTAGTSALKAYEKFNNSKQNEKGLEDLRDQTKGMNTIAGQNGAHFSGDTQITSGDSDGSSRLASTVGPAASVCDEPALETALGSIRCAAQADPALPPYLKSEEFLRDLQKATGKSPDVFFGGFESPAQAIGDSEVTKGMSPAQAAGLADSLAAMDGYTARKVAAVGTGGAPATGNYRAVGGGREIPMGEDDLDMNGMLAGMLGQLGADGQPIDENGAAVMAEGSVDRAPANVVSPENRAVSIFDRVKWRYGALSKSSRIGGLAP